ncbi:MAG TPA: tRNA (adenosine(37)-N6)-dimethylallyltransferase MiaA [Sandaracinaceae bacterium LLY-WYZ-13_1]|nr:tRNA (adenosine(37)-N6)-dimethylallyltransferase MiaA [Sandaracinaceae bacterium LLY-WYZ-13_1]
MSGRPRIVVVAGVTAAGKTGAAIALARHLDGELVGADSVQIYRGFDIGSAKPTAAELGGVRHHLIDVLDPDASIDAAGFAALADGAIAEVASRGRVPLVVGGTGLWIRALLRGLVELPPPDPAVRARLEAEADTAGSAALHARLAAVDPRCADRVHPHDRRRIVRALEVHEQTGRPLGELQAEHALGAPRYEALPFVLDLPREALYAALRARIDAMLEAGWVEEVRALLARWGPEVRPMKSVGYRQMAAHVREGVPLDEARRQAYQATRVYTRRQRTWFRGELDERPGSGDLPPTQTTAAELVRRPSMDAIRRWVRRGR